MASVAPTNQRASAESPPSVRSTQEYHGPPSVTLTSSSSSSSSSFTKTTITTQGPLIHPSAFQRVALVKQVVHFTTEDVSSASTRVLHCAERIEAETARILETLVKEILPLMQVLSKASECVAMVDLLHSFSLLARGGVGAGAFMRIVSLSLSLSLSLASVFAPFTYSLCFIIFISIVSVRGRCCFAPSLARAPLHRLIRAPTKNHTYPTPQPARPSTLSTTAHTHTHTHTHTGKGIRSGSSEGPWVRPIFLPAWGVTKIVRGRHPTVEAFLPPGSTFYSGNTVILGGVEFQPLPLQVLAPAPGGPVASVGPSSPPTPNLVLLSGPNASGKSTLLLTVGVIYVLAHIGCVK